MERQITESTAMQTVLANKDLFIWNLTATAAPPFINRKEIAKNLIAH
jgi:hypothetical protein